MPQCAPACVITVPAFQRRCGTVCSILSSLLKTKDWEWAWQLCARLLNRTAARSQLKTLMEVARGLDLCFRPMDLRHDCFEQPRAPRPRKEKNWASCRSL